MPALPDLLTSAELYAAAGVVVGDLTDAEVSKYTFAIKAASQAVRNYTGRTFEIATGALTARTFQYDGSGFLEINDCQSVLGVAGVYGSVSRDLLAEEFLAQPYDGQPVFEWLQLVEGVWGVGSPEMGFKRNLDKLYGTMPMSAVLMTVTANWGWSEIPYDVRQAVIWTATALSEDPNGYQSESIEGYSRSKGPFLPNEIIPQRGLAALDSYIKVKV